MGAQVQYPKIVGTVWRSEHGYGPNVPRFQEMIKRTSPKKETICLTISSLAANIFG